RQLLELPGALGCSPTTLGLLQHLTSPDGEPPVSNRDRSPTASLEPIEDALVELFRAVTSEIPILISVDDAHWLSPRCTRLISRCMSDSSIVRTCIIVATRDYDLRSTPWA